MAQWGATDNAANSVNWAARTIEAGSGPVHIAANNTALYGNTTVDAFIKNMAIGQFGVSKTEMKVTSAEGKKTHAPGWSLRRAFEGPIKTIQVANGVFTNGETLTISGGSVNGSVTLTTNATGNLVSGVITKAGTFPNTSVLVYTFDRQKHLNNISVTGGTLAYNNTDYIVVANATTNGVANVTTNATGYITNSGITLTNIGLFANTKANTDVTITVYAANGALSNGTGATLVANLAVSTGGGATATLGGRAGRVTYESLAVVKNITSGTSDDTYLPNS